ncbi:alpha-galactosidase [Salinispira pacifica]|uniref:alpha-galactosidase n=1 Tax=Salinispira pacifica TaxID=1307761 RepID=V5WKU2_9SPIO|nr:alpha-galactosidase [Salinispira pacifica]AHC16159.1 Alpha-galactosidase [Salinispira pacifica]
MIAKHGSYFHLASHNSSLILHIRDSGHPELLHFGARIRDREDGFPGLIQDFSFIPGIETAYSEDGGFSLQTISALMPGSGKGDYRLPALELEYDDGSSICDFLYHDHRIYRNSGREHTREPSHSHADSHADSVSNSDSQAASQSPEPAVSPEPVPGARALPMPRAPGETLELILKEAVHQVFLHISYDLFPETDVFACRCRLVNRGRELHIHRIMSMNLDLSGDDWDFISLEGKWIREKHIQRSPVPRGRTSISSRRFASGADHNPFLILASPGTGETEGECMGFSLMYSGNHEMNLERSEYGQVRVQCGIHDHDFRWRLGEGEQFSAPAAFFSFSSGGLGALSIRFHRFIREHVIPPRWRNRTRPLLFNSWEALYFDFDETRLLQLAKKGKKLGMELFVVDDGWFQGRNDDHSSLGDWVADSKKLPGGIQGLSRKVRKLGLQFGIWIEPEMISPDSDLYRSHPEWAISSPLREPSLGRHQLMLDMSNPRVVDHLHQTLRTLFLDCEPDYVKWDMNRSISDPVSAHLPASRQKELGHRYTLGVYELLKRLTDEFPDILLETCASGGNRFDAGMLFYSPQIWTSDNTDPGSRVKIQHGSSLLYPQHCAAAHVGSDPSHQTLRNSSVSTRFHCAAFAPLGYELDLQSLSPFDEKIISGQVALYKEHRELFQFGTFHRLASPFEGNTAVWQLYSEETGTGIVGYFQLHQEASPVRERIRLRGLDPGKKYTIRTAPHFLNILRFGELINGYLPFKVKASGLRGLAHKVISDNYLFPAETREVSAYGDELMEAGFRLWPQFTGTGYNDRVRIMGDVSSRLYILQAVDEAAEPG